MSLQLYYLPLIYLITLFGFCFITKELNLIAKPTPQILARQSPIDGLRGILATSVFAFHFYINYGFGKTGLWQSPNHPFLLNMGAVPVSLFFMITGFLFFNKMRKPTTDWQTTYTGRFKRIYPLYLALAGVSVLIILLQNRFTVNASELAKWLVGWLWFDVKPFKPFFAKPLIVGAVWTLVYEWAFYSALPLLAMLWHKKTDFSPKNMVFVASTFVLAVFLFRQTITQLYWLFAFSLVAIHFADWFKALQQKFPNVLNVILPIAVIVIMQFTQPYSWLQMGLLSLIFGFVANGYSFFGGLYHRSLIFLGEISYSVYLLHGVMVYGLFYGLKAFDFGQSFAVYAWWLVPTFVLTVIVAFFAHKFIEMPFYLSRRKQ